MAKQTRQQRRDRRAQQQPALAGGSPPPPAPTRPVSNGDSEPARRPPREERQESGGFGPFTFVHESWAELKKVEWPDQKAVISGTAVVLIACLIVGAYLYVNDQIWQYVVKHVLLR